MPKMKWKEFFPLRVFSIQDGLNECSPEPLKDKVA